jgi:hypothetical protein
VIASFFDAVDVTNVILLLGLVGVFITKVGEGRGWFRSAAGLRIENTDLLRRNAELEAAIGRGDIALAGNDARILVLEQTIRDLEKLDQSAVLQALKDHELGAIGRAERTHSLQETTNGALDRIVAVLESRNA